MDDVWIFGYGSLIWRPAFPYLERWPGYVIGFKRRFWQESPNHRGTPELPGRVATLLREPGARCWGMVYRVAASDVEEVVSTLDARERPGYEQVYTDAHVSEGVGTVRALLYVATAGNPCFVGERPLAEIASVARRAQGPSGSNQEYVLRLAEALEAMGAEDEHVRELARRVMAGEVEAGADADSLSGPDAGSDTDSDAGRRDG